jgi:hypothetical protein
MYETAYFSKIDKACVELGSLAIMRLSSCLVNILSVHPASDMLKSGITMRLWLITGIQTLGVPTQWSLKITASSGVFFEIHIIALQSAVDIRFVWRLLRLMESAGVQNRIIVAPKITVNKARAAINGDFNLLGNILSEEFRVLSPNNS